MEMLTAAEIRRNAADLAPLESQKEYRERISTFIRMHTARVNALDSGIRASSLPGNSMMIIARTGCGKSYTISRLCKAAGVNLITVDCSALTLTGYKGSNLGELLLGAKAGIPKGEFERSIVLFDEVDKMRMNGVEGNPQPNFLKLFDGTVQADARTQASEIIDVSGMSFLFAGAFAGLDEIIRRRLAPRSIGFSAVNEDRTRGEDIMSLATMQDIRDYGFMDELLGRIGSLFYVPPLTPADYRRLIKGGEGSVLLRYENLFNAAGVALDISDSACACIAREADRSALGARSVDPMVYNCLQGAFDRLDEDKSVNSVTVTCRKDSLTLRYGHGDRKDRAGEERKETKESPLFSLPDVSLARYMKDEHGTDELLQLALTVYNRSGTEEEARLAAFLRCCFLMMKTLGREEDLVLSSVSKLANATEMVDDTSCFDRIITERIKRWREEYGDEKEFADAYVEYCRYHDKDSHRFWMDAVKDIRRKWYRNLLQVAG